MNDLLVIGYGNELRGDDGVGPKVAAAVAAWKQAGVRALICHQLTPELAHDIAAARAVIFVDAALPAVAPTVQVRAIAPADAAQLRAHTSDPPALLALAQTTFGRTPPAWTITVPAVNFDFGERLSPLAEQGMAAALEHIRSLCQVAPVIAEP